jgi:hypothetical protein
VGELRTSIIEMGKQVTAAAKMGDALGAELEKTSERVGSLVERVYAGHDVLWLYLEAKFKKDGRNVSDFKNDKLSEHADSEVLTYLKGVDAAANDALKAINDFAALKNKMPAEYQRIDTVATAIRRNIEKKRAKLFQSKKYKAKLVTYEKGLDELVGAIAARRKAFERITAKSVKTVEDLRLKPTNKIDEVRHISVKAEIENVRKAEENNVAVARQMRQNGDLKKALDTMKQWAMEADSMDQEVLNLDPNAAKPLKDVKIFDGRTLLCTAPKAMFQGKRPMEIASVTWAKGVDSLSYLQKKVRIEAKYVQGDGSFANDMKINGIKGQIVKLS